MKYKQNRFIHFDEADPAGILFFGEIYKISHRSLEAFIQHIGIKWEEWFDDKLIGAPVVHVDTQFKRPIKAGETYEIHIACFKLSQSTVGFQFEYVNSDNQETHAIVKTVHTFVDKSKLEKTKMPQIFHERLNRYLL